MKAEEAKALEEKRDAKKKEVEAQALKDEEDYKEKMEKVNDLVGDAKQSQQAYETYDKKVAAAQKIREGLSEKQLKKDADIGKCKDEVQCMDKDTHECKDLTKDGPYLADDLISCQDEPGDWDTMSDTDAVEDWGLDLGAEPTPPPVVYSEECLARIKDLPEAAHAAYAAYKEDHSVNPLEYVFCTSEQSKDGHFVEGSLTNQGARDELTKIFDMLNVCPDICFPDTALTVSNDNDSVTSDESICIDKADWAQFKQQVIDIPTYTASGTKTKADPKGRFPAGQSLQMCTLAKNMADGFRGGSGEDTTPGA